MKGKKNRKKINKTSIGKFKSKLKKNRLKTVFKSRERQATRIPENKPEKKNKTTNDYIAACIFTQKIQPTFAFGTRHWRSCSINFWQTNFRKQGFSFFDVSYFWWSTWNTNPTTIYCLVWQWWKASFSDLFGWWRHFDFFSGYFLNIEIKSLNLFRSFHSSTQFRLPKQFVTFLMAVPTDL